jgi:hypothetical protein
MAKTTAATSEAQGFQSAPEVVENASKPATLLDSITTETTLLSACQHTLPIGWFDANGERQQSFTLKAFTGKDELELSALTTRYRDKIAEVLPVFLSRMIETIGGTPIAEVAKSQSLSTQKLCENLFLADALQVLLQLRLDAIGPDVQLSGQCPICQTVNKDREGEYSDLSTVEVQMVKGLTHPIIEIVLPDGATVFEDFIKRIQIRAPKLYDLKRMAKQAKDGQAEYRVNHRILLNTVVGLPESEAYGNSMNSDRTAISAAGIEALYEQLTARDRSYLQKCINKVSNFGPAMTIEMVCRACGYDDWSAEVPWRDLPTFLSYPA